MSEYIALPLIVGACVIAIICAVVWCSLAWQPYDMKLQEDRIEVSKVCIQSGGIWNGSTCQWSRQDAVKP